VSQAYRFIDPHAIASISDLHLVARTIVDGFLFGEHGSVVPGAGIEFSQFRSYQPGDDLRRVDWKLYARSDRYYVRESDIETNVSVRFLLDASESMAHTEGGITKFDYARFLIASLSYLAVSQGDAVSLHSINEIDSTILPARQGRQHLHRLLHELEELKPSARFPEWNAIEQAMVALSRRELILVVSDMHERDEELTTLLVKLSHLGHEVMLLHLLGPDEIAFNHKGFVAFEDLETGKVVEVDAESARQAYQRQMQEHIGKLGKQLRDENITANLITTDQPLDFALRSYLTHRAHLR
jgi:uncharacterized protein (DUF58 family)